MLTIFQKIIDREIPADIVMETEDALAFRDVAPVAPVHILVIPKKPIVRISETNVSDAALLGKLMLMVRDVARQEGMDETGYRVITNNGADAGQSVDHLHFHIIGGRQLGWPPG